MVQNSKKFEKILMRSRRKRINSTQHCIKDFRKSLCMTINEHAACALCSGEVPVTLYSVSIQAERNAVDES